MPGDASPGNPVAYDPAYEFPGDDDNDPHSDFHAQASSSSPKDIPICRLVVRESKHIPRKKRLVVLDGYTEAQFGRDPAPPGFGTPRIRLKDMEVSKLHATLFWDPHRHEWAVVDMGSKHGTFISSDQAVKGARLSAPRIASMPKRVQHLDRLSLGTTNFVVHIHASQLPCVDCSMSAQDTSDVIPLFSQQKGDATIIPNKQKRGHSEESTGAVPPRDVKKALTSLKHSLLSRHGDDHHSALQLDESSRTSTYVDRSARRRALHPPSAADTPGLQPVSLPSYALRVSNPATPSLTELESPRSATPAPLGSANVGHRLLMKQGWEPGTTLGLPEAPNDADRARLTEPLELTATSNRAGIGIATHRVPSDLKMQRRWEEAKRI
ncbi:hypothetical protein BC834DRAFT_826384 [Gloeopeniophorella convolvens]|nr:hypothetical protein BC834DRAFT_826384 [Gloeopeniophorella convolvens]